MDQESEFIIISFQVQQRIKVRLIFKKSSVRQRGPILLGTYVVELASASPFFNFMVHDPNNAKMVMVKLTHCPLNRLITYTSYLEKKVGILAICCRYFGTKHDAMAKNNAKRQNTT